MSVCLTCEGRGWVEHIDHEDACYRAGDCVGCGGVQVQIACPDCTPKPEPIGDADVPF